MKTSHELRKKKKKPIISGPLYIEPINGKEFKNSPPSAKKVYQMRQESFSAFLEQDVYMSSVLLAEQRRAAGFGVRDIRDEGDLCLFVCLSNCLSVYFSSACQL